MDRHVCNFIRPKSVGSLEAFKAGATTGGDGGIDVGAKDHAGYLPCATANYFVDGLGKRWQAHSRGVQH